MNSIGSCTAFLIDIVDGALSILYERFYEIYGDIHGASNAAKFGAYVQGSKRKISRHLHN